MQASAYERLQAVLKADRARILSSLIRTCGGDFDLAEEALHDAVVAATTQWPRRGIPDAPDAWLLQTARHKAIDSMRRDRRARSKLNELGHSAELLAQSTEPEEEESMQIPYDMLRLIFTCCHPALNDEARLALTLRTVAGLPTIEIARAFLVTEQTMAQRLVRAKRKIRQARIPYRVPERSQMPARLEAVLLVIYLLFNEGYSASSGAEVVRHELCTHAIHIARVLSALMPEEGDVRGLLALMLLQDSRRDSRTDAKGDLVLLRDQDRTLWSQEQIEEGLRLCDETRQIPSPGGYSIQAAIAAEHARAAVANDTDWREIARLYEALLTVRPTPVVALNHAVAISIAYGAEEGLQLLTPLAEDLDGYGPFHAAHADFCRTTGRRQEAERAYLRAIAIATNDPERRFLEGRLRELQGLANS